MILYTQGVFIASTFPSEPDRYLVNSYFNSKGLKPDFLGQWSILRAKARSYGISHLPRALARGDESQG